MKRNFYKLLLMASIIILPLVSCKKSENIEPVLVKITYSPAFHNSAEVIVNASDKTLLFFSPYETFLETETNFDSVEDSLSYQKYVSERPPAEPFVSEITEAEAKEIKDLALKLKNFQKKALPPVVDGINLNIAISYSDKSIKHINLDSSDDTEYPLYKRLIHLALAKNKSKNNTIILNKIEDYF